MSIGTTVNLEKYPLADNLFKQQCLQTLNNEGVLVLPDFLTENTLKALHSEGKNGIDKAYFKHQLHNVYLTPNDSQYSDDHVFNRQIISSKGCITDDFIQSDSALRKLYDSDEFKNFLCHVLGEEALYPYQDTLSSINLHYAEKIKS